jgi:hypothetical protein
MLYDNGMKNNGDVFVTNFMFYNDKGRNASKRWVIY